VNILNWIGNNRTKIAGYMGVMLGAMEMNLESLQWIPAPKRGMLLFILGIVTAGIGHYNDRHREDNDK
jgi:hypothetical protein